MMIPIALLSVELEEVVWNGGVFSKIVKPLRLKSSNGLCRDNFSSWK